MTLLVTGVTTRGLLISLAVGIGVMIIAGMLSMLLKLLPWVLCIALGVWIFRSRDKKAVRCRQYLQNYVARVRKSK